MFLNLKCFMLTASLFVISNASVQTVPPDWNTAIDSSLFENVLDSEECERQLRYIRNNATIIRTQFMDASWRPPRSFLMGNTRDFGNYLQCLDINEQAADMTIEGKYCMIDVPLSMGLSALPNIAEISSFENLSPWQELLWKELIPRADVFTDDMRDRLHTLGHLRNNILAQSGILQMDGALGFDDGEPSMNFNLAVCIPKVCTTREALDFFTFNLTGNMAYTENFCRLPNDKPWVPVDTIAVVLLSVIGLITLLSSAYDIRHTVLLKKDPKEANKICQSFSVYSNTRNFFVFPNGPNVVTSLDGVRSIAMLWVVVGHAFSSQMSFLPQNLIDILDYMQALRNIWLFAAPITVDTFFFLSGLLVVYTTASKISRRGLLKNIHLFYLNRLLRMFPVLAFTILMTASFLQRLGDGPNFATIEYWVNNCRVTWWSTLLYVQNWVNPEAPCLPHAWYLAIDMQLYFISPLVLFWILGKCKMTSWIALFSSLFAVLLGSSVYNFINNFQSGATALARPPEESTRYMTDYYINTLARAAPFFVGLIFGYLLHVYRGKQLRMSWAVALCLWVLALCGTTMCFINGHWTIQFDWDNQLIDNLINSFERPIWAAAVGWIVFACHKGFGGPVNWFLSLHVFKILGRLSYAMYLLHYPLMYVNMANLIAIPYFTTYFTMYRFFSELSITLITAFLVTILIDFPFANLIKIALEGKKTPSKEHPMAKSLYTSNSIEPPPVSKLRG